MAGNAVEVEDGLWDHALVGQGVVKKRTTWKPGESSFSGTEDEALGERPI